MTLLQSNIGGSGAYARGLLEALRRRRDDVQVDVITAGAGGAGTLSWMASGSRSAVRRLRPDVLHCPGFLLPFNPGAPMVVTIHDLSLGKMPEGPLEWRAYYRLLFPQLVRGARAVITPTEVTRQDVIHSLRVSAERVTVTPYGVDPRFSADSKPAAPSSDAPRILFSGPPIKRKNLDTALRALASAPADGLLQRARLLITGARGDDFPQYRRMITELGLTERVEWLGMVPFEDLPGLYASVDLFTYPSWLEGFGFPPLEAMAAGTPVVASNASCLPEVLDDAALLVDPADHAALAAAMESVLRDPVLRRRLVEAGRARARTFNWDRCADLTLAVYRRAADSFKRGETVA
jgi:alpha-1,3-rhamnosyl/mannosyltransferase